MADTHVLTYFAAYSHWSSMVMRLSKELQVNDDQLKQIHTAELYSVAADKLAEEVCYTYVGLFHFII